MSGLNMEVEPLPTLLTASLLRTMTVKWMKSDPLSGTISPLFLALRESWKRGISEEKGTEDHRLELLFNAAIPMCKILPGVKPKHEHLQELGTAFLQLAVHLSQHSEALAALGRAQSAAHFIEYSRRQGSHSRRGAPGSGTGPTAQRRQSHHGRASKISASAHRSRPKGAKVAAGGF
jgi:hypothetical protein